MKASALQRLEAAVPLTSSPSSPHSDLSDVERHFGVVERHSVYPKAIPRSAENLKSVALVEPLSTRVVGEDAKVNPVDGLLVTRPGNRRTQQQAAASPTTMRTGDAHPQFGSMAFRLERPASELEISDEFGLVNESPCASSVGLVNSCCPAQDFSVMKCGYVVWLGLAVRVRVPFSVLTRAVGDARGKPQIPVDIIDLEEAHAHGVMACHDAKVARNGGGTGTNLNEVNSTKESGCLRSSPRWSLDVP